MGIRERFLLGFYLALLGFGIATPSGDATAGEVGSYTFAIVREESSGRLAEGWGQIIERLGRATGTRLQLLGVPDRTEFERGLAGGEYDLAYMNPYEYVRFSNDGPRYRAFAKESDKRARGVLVVSKDAPFEDPTGLEGRVLAFPSPDAFAASILVRDHLQGQGIAFTPEYLGLADSVYDAVVEGRYPAAGGSVDTLKAQVPGTRDRLRVIWTSASYAPAAIAAHPRVPAELVERLDLAMAEMSDDRDGRALLARYGIRGFDLARDSDWDDVRALGIEPAGSGAPGGL